MRIAYIANYQGPTLGHRRPIVRNLSMSNRVKMELIAGLLHGRSHDVVIISPGEPGEPRLRFFPSFREPELFNRAISVEYVSAFPIRTVTAAWSSLSTVRRLRARHNEEPFDVVVVFNMKWPQLAAAAYAMKALDIPVLLEYEDDAFTTVHEERLSPLTGPHRRACRRLLQSVDGCIGVSPYLLSQVRADIPKLMLRGVVGSDVIEAEGLSRGVKQKWVVFAGTHIESNGVAQLVEAWKRLRMTDWELHITGSGHLTETLKASAAGVPNITFHGLVSRHELVQIISSGSICINPHQVSKTPGIVFAFKIIEYLAAGAHVVTTPMGDLESALEQGVTYLPDNSPDSIAAVLQDVIRGCRYEKTAAAVTHAAYGPEAVSTALDHVISDVVVQHQRGRNPVQRNAPSTY